jgi:glycogen operon protein
VKLIAEPWDLGGGGYRLGAFPEGWAEWNDRFRDTVRAFWRGDRVPARELVERLTGSRDVLGPAHSVDYVTSHDGFTLADLVSYTRKRNAANGEDDRDGSDHNLSANWGVEGPTDDQGIRAQRLRVQRSVLATVVLAGDVPMIAHGDELGRSQGGNNNAYCHDGPTSWVDWALDWRRSELLEFTRRAFALRRRLRRRSVGAKAEELRVRWLSGDGELHEPEQGMRRRGAIGVLYETASTVGAPHALLLLLNGSPQPRTWVLPELVEGTGWSVLLDSAEPERATGERMGRTARVAPSGLLALEALARPAAC